MNHHFTFLCTSAVCAGGLLLGCNDEVDSGIADLTDVPSFAVHRSDFESAAVALLDGDGKLLDDTYISSGSEPPGLNAALHGDIALPTSACDPEMLTVVARFGGDYVIEIDLEEGEVTRQVATQTSDLDQGDDIAIIDMASEEITGRIDLSEVRMMVEGTDENGDPVEELAYARPTGMVQVGERFAVVALGRLSASWIAGPGILGVIDLEERELHATYEIDGLKNCVALVEVPDRDDAVIVECSGYPYGDAGSAGVALITVSEDGDVHEEAALRDQETPALFSGTVSLGGTRIVTVAQGDFAEEIGDEAVIVDLDSGDREDLFGTDEPGSIGSGAYRSATGLLLIPDAERGVRLFDVDDDEIAELETVELDEALPARTVRALRR